MAKIRVGLIGSGFVAQLHMAAYRRVHGLDLEVSAVVSRGDHVLDFASKHGIASTHREYQALLADKDIDVVDICAPPGFHAAMIVEAMRAGKHVICEKPFTGYFGRPGDRAPIGRHVAKSVMYERVMTEMEDIRRTAGASGRLFMYAEDWVYAPAVAKMAEIVKAAQDRILFIKAEESHSGSHAAHAAEWSLSGGGSLIRMGCHPLSTILYLKQMEAAARGETIAVASVVADVGHVTAGLAPAERPYITARPIDVEDWGTLTLTFSDGTKGTIFAGDMILGGVRNTIEVHTGGGCLVANITPNNHLTSYLTDETKLAEVYLTEKVDRKTGWQFICLEEEWTRGYLQEIQDFMECVALGREPRAGIDLAFDTMKVCYAGYWSAEEGRRIAF